MSRDENHAMINTTTYVGQQDRLKYALFLSLYAVRLALLTPQRIFANVELDRGHG